MKRAIGVAIVSAAAISAAAFGYIYLSSTSHNPSSGQEGKLFSPTWDKGELEGVHIRNTSLIKADSFLDFPLFRSSKTSYAKNLNGATIAGVVNHHVLASDLLARFFSTLRAARPDLRRMIILSPDHFKSGDATISIGQDSYTSFGKKIAVDEAAEETLTRIGVAVTGSRQLFEREHGIGAIIPFLAETFPDITIVPIAIRADVNRSDAEKLGRALQSLVDDKTFVLISSDMSHYLSENDALARDRETLSWLETLDATKFKQVTDDNTDNGPSFVALSELLDDMKIKPTFRELDHSISSKYGGSRANTTSYITGFWIK